MLRRALLVALLSCAVAAPARAADPIMPLSEVRAGMVCSALSVVRGTEIASFDVEVLDVIAEDPAFGGARLLVRVSGPAVDATGVGPGFSGSPILCGGRNAGAISEALGQYGNHVVLATPIEAILSTRPVRAPAGARRAPRLLRSARPLVGPLTASGLSPGSQRLLARAARKAGRSVLAAPAGPLGGYPVQELTPGAAVAGAFSSGDVSIGAVGTVAYRDGEQVYAFGHSLEGLGPRTMFLQDSYVFDVIENPLGVPDLGAITYKLTSSGGHVVGALTNDSFSGIYGTTDARPPSIPLRVEARERGGDAVALRSRLADERALGLGAGMSFIAPLATSTALDRLLGSVEPATMRLCTRFRIRRQDRPIGFCNTYFDGLTAVTDVAEASSLVESFDLAPLGIEAANVGITARRGVIDEVLVGADAPARVRRGSTMSVRLSLRRRGGPARSRIVRVPVPRDLRPGPGTLVLAGNGFPAEDGDLVLEIVDGLTRSPARAGQRQPARPRARAAQREARSVRELASQVAALERPLGVTARFRGREPRTVLRSNDVRFDGRVRVRLRVLRASR